jgi:perosamine synthetase
LHLALAAQGLGPVDEVIIPTFTMIATANAVSYTGARPIVVDAHEDDWNIDVTQIEAKVTPRTKCIVIVHTYGQPARMDVVHEIAQRHQLTVIEDSAEAHGAEYRGRAVGSLGDAATFSFYGNKIVTTGEGGMVTTNDATFAQLVRRLRDHAFSSDRHFWHEYLGFNYRMTNLQAALGLAQTERLSELVERRRTLRAQYDASLKNVPGISVPAEMPHTKSVSWMYTILVDEAAFGCSRDDLRRSLARRGIETRTLFIPIHLQPIYFHQFLSERFPIAERLCRLGLYLPSGPTMKEPEVEYVVQSIRHAATGQ